MSNQNTRPNVGQESTDPSITTASHEDEDVIAFLEEFVRYLDVNLPRVQAACARYDARIKAEREADPPPTPGLAHRTDGKWLLSIAYTRDEIPEGREVWTGVVNRLAQILALVQPPDRSDGHRASQMCVCELCDTEYGLHADDPLEPWMTMLCDGRTVKL